MEMDYDIRREGNHYALYVNDKFISTGDSKEECESDYQEYLESVQKIKA